MPLETEIKPASRLFTPTFKLLIAAAVIVWALFIVYLVRAGTSVVDYEHGNYDQAIELDADGNPMIAYFDAESLDNTAMGPLYFTRCNDPDCVGGDDYGHLLDVTGTNDVSMVLDSDGNPVLSYGDGLHLMHCNDPDCAGGDESLEYVNGITTSTVGSPPFNAIQHTSSLQLNAAGNPVIALAQSNGVLRLITCNDPNCAGWNEPNVVLDPVNSANPVLLLDSSGNPVIAYSAINSAFKVIRCSDPACSGKSTVSLATTGGINNYLPSMRLDSQGFPVIAYTSSHSPSPQLTLIHCNDVNCAGNNEGIQVIATGSSYWGSLSLHLDASGNPLILFSSNEGDEGSRVRLIHCNDPNCGGGNETASRLTHPTPKFTFHASVLDANQNPVVSYARDTAYSSLNPELNLIHCDDSDCLPSLPTLTAPTNLQFVQSGLNVTLTWTDNSSDETSFYISRLGPDNVDFVNVGSVGANVTTFNDTLPGCGYYFYRIRSYRASDGLYSGYAFRAGTTAGNCTAPTAATGLVATAVSGYKVNLVWQDNSSNELWFRVSRTGGFIPMSRYVDADQASYVDEYQLQCGTTYTYSVAAGSRGGPSSTAATTTVTTSPCGPPAAPSSLAANAGLGQIDLTWADNSPDETNFRIERSLNGSTGWQEIRRNAADDDSYSDADIDCNTTYYYRVRSYRAVTGQYSGYSSIQSTTSLPCTNAPELFDPNFGVDGIALLEEPATIAHNLIVLPDGKILVSDTNYTLRFHSDGSLDTSFGSGGFVEFTGSIAVDPVGRMIVMSWYAENGDKGIRFTRYLADGSLDTSFGTGGFTNFNYPSPYSPGASDVFVLPDGKILGVAGGSLNPQSTYVLYRLTATGAPDGTFGSSGIVASTLVSPNFRGKDAVLQSDGKLLVIGNGLVSPSQETFKVARINTNGTLDTTFSGDGVAEATFVSYFDVAHDVIVQADGKILLGGRTRSTSNAPLYAALARFNSNGSLDTSFNSTGMLIAGPAHSTFYALAVQPDHKILAIGISGESSDSGYITRFLEDGTLDTSFGEGGIVTLNPSYQAALFTAQYVADQSALVVGGAVAAPLEEIPCDYPYEPEPCYGSDVDLMLAKLIMASPAPQSSYLMFAGGSCGPSTIDISGSSFSFIGDIHSNDGVEFTVGGSGITMYGDITAVGDVDYDPFRFVDPPGPPSVTASDLLAYPLSWDVADFAPGGQWAQIAAQNGDYYVINDADNDFDVHREVNGDLKPGIYYVTGAFQQSPAIEFQAGAGVTIVMGSAAAGEFRVGRIVGLTSPYVAEGLPVLPIIFSAYQPADPCDTSAGNAAVVLGPQTYPLGGIIYAPYGAVTMSSSSFTDSYLSVYAHAIDVTGSDYEITAPMLYPTNLSATPISNTQIDLSWDDNAFNETSFSIERLETGGEWTEIGITTANDTTFSDTGLPCNRGYEYRVRAHDSVSGQYSIYSHTSYASTGTCPPTATPTLTPTNTPTATATATNTPTATATATATSSPTATATNTSVPSNVLGMGYHEENHPYVTFSGAWTIHTYAPASGGVYRYTNDPGAKVNFSFAGTKLTLYRAVAYNRGAMLVCIDGTCQTVQNYSANVIWQVPVSFNVAAGTHAVEIRNTSNAYIDLDAIRVESTAPIPTNTPSSTPTSSLTPTKTNTPTLTATPTNTSTPTLTLTPSNTPVNTATATQTNTPTATATHTAAPANVLGVGLHQENHAYVTFTGPWLIDNNASASGGQYRYTNGPTAKVNFSFAGDKLTLYRAMAFNRGAMQVCIDGNCQTVQNYSANVVWQAPVSFNVAPGTHAVEIRNASTNYIDLDAIRVEASAPIPTNTPTLTPTATQTTTPTLSITPITWNVIGLDAADVNQGPNEYPVGVRVCNTGAGVLNSIAVTYEWTGAVNDRISLINSAAQPISSLNSGACDDVYFWVRVTRNAASLNTSRTWRITATAGAQSVNTTQTLLVQGFTAITGNSTAVMNGPTSLTVGQTAQYSVTAQTAVTNQELMHLINFCPDLFAIDTVAVTYTQPTNGTNDRLWASGSAGGATFGGGVNYTISVKALAAGNCTLRNAVYGLNNGAYQYNNDYAADTIAVSIGVPQPTATHTLTPTLTATPTQTATPTSTPTATATATNTTVPGGALGIGFHQENHPSVTFTGAWITHVYEPASGGVYRYTNDPNAKVNFSFTGTKLTLYRAMAFNRGPMLVCIDGNCQTVQNYSANVVWQAPVSFIVAAGTHTVEIRNASNGYIDLDAIRVE